MFFHQAANSIGDKIYNAFLYRGVAWKAHLHRSYEYCFVTSGSVLVTVDNLSYRLQGGDSLLIPPFVTHSYLGGADSVCLIAVFSGNYVPAFDKLSQTQKPLSHRFVQRPETSLYIAKSLGYSDLPSPPPGDRISVPMPEELTLRACLYALVSDFSGAVAFEKKSNETDLLQEILGYVQAHYTENLTLRGMCRDIGFSYEYISKVFNRALGVNFKTLVNQYRCEHAERLLELGQKSISDVAMESGFQSIRTFNRVYLEYTGHAPTEHAKRD